jgi:adenylate cyclase, class 2
VSSKPQVDREQEVKFYLSRPDFLVERLEEAGAVCVHTRVHEFNLRFDTTESELGASKKVLRLRQDTEARMTFKGPSDLREGVNTRQEIEFRVDDFAAARRLLEALGYQIDFIYEKYRSTYTINMGSGHTSASPESHPGTLITLDELPFGDFAEIEGPDSDSIQLAARLLGLDWEARILHSYAAMFKALKQQLGLAFRDLVFSNFQGVEVTPQDLQVRPSDAGR